MQIRKDSWHANLYRRAYVTDRAWINLFGPPVHDHEIEKRIPDEVAASDAAQRAYHALLRQPVSSDEERKATRELVCQTGEAYQQAYRRVYKELLIEKQAAEAEAVQKRMDEGRLSLCPYFWSIVWAVLFYTCLCRPTRWVFVTLFGNY